MSTTGGEVVAETTPLQAPRARGKWLRRLAWTLLVLAVLFLLAWQVLPRVARSQGEQRLTQLLGRPVTIGAVEFKPWTLEVTVRDVAIAGTAPAAEPLLHVARLYANITTASIWKRAPVVQSLEVDAPVLHVTRIAEGRYDIDDLIAKFTPDPNAPASSEPAHFALHNLQLRDGALSFDDKPVGRRHELKRLEVTLPFVSNLPSDVEVKVQPRLAFELNGTSFDSGAVATPFAPERNGAFQLHIGDAAQGDLDLAPYLGYVPKSLPVRIVRGHVGADLDMLFSAAAGGKPSLSIKGSVRASDFAVTDTDGAPLAGFAKLVVPLADVQPLARQVHLGAVQLEGVQLQASRDAEGSLNLQRLSGTSASPVASGPPADAASSTPAPASATSAASASASAVAAASASAASAAVPASAASAAVPASAASSTQSAAAKPPEGWRIDVDSVVMNSGSVRWNDATVAPAAAYLVDEIHLDAKAVHWPGPKPVAIGLSAQLRGQGDAAPVAGRISIQGEANDKAARLELRLDGVSLPIFAPYVAQTLAPRLDGQLDANGRIDWAAGADDHLKLSLTDATLAGLRMVQQAAATGKRGDVDLFSLKQLRLAGVEVDVPGRTVDVASLALQAPDVKLARDREGGWNVQQWLVTKAQVAGRKTATAVAQAASGTDAAPAKSGSGWQAQLHDFKLDAGHVGWVDERPRAGAAAPVRLNLSGLQIGAQGLAWDDRGGASPNVPPAKLQLAAKLASADDAAERGEAAGARLEWKGDVGLQPVLARGTVLVQRFPVHAFVPYVDVPLRLTLQRALAGYRGDVSVRVVGKGLDISAKGDVRIRDLDVLSKPDVATVAPSELLSWRNLELRGLSFAMAPGGKPRIDIPKAELNEFYARLLVTEQGRLNLQDVAPSAAGADGKSDARSDAKSDGKAAANAGADVATNPSTGASSPVSPAAAAPVAAASAAASSPGVPVAPPSALPIDLTVGGVALHAGRIDFSDHFVKPNYSAALTELEGSLGAFRSGSTEMASLELHGRAEGTAVLEITGKLNPTANPLALDIHAKATDLELAPLSPYAGKYAGYAIERGKLTMDISYDIQPDGRLNAKNQVVLNQLTFGDKVDSPTATKLPVLLAVALLKDRNGVIDINLPISGSLNDPQFSVGGLIVKVLFNLLAKALTSPFALLTGGFGGGGGDDLSTLEFQPGTAKLTDSGPAALDKVAKALEQRPALKMTVTGASDPAQEREAFRRAVFEQRLLAERKRELVRARAPADAPVTVNAEDRDRLVKTIYGDTKLDDKPRNMLGIARDIPTPEMEKLLLATIPVSAEAMRELALQRGLAVRDALIAKGLSSDRLFMAAPKVMEGDEASKPAADGEKPGPWKPSVKLSLSTH